MQRHEPGNMRFGRRLNNRPAAADQRENLTRDAALRMVEEALTDYDRTIVEHTLLRADVITAFYTFVNNVAGASKLATMYEEASREFREAVPADQFSQVSDPYSELQAAVTETDIRAERNRVCLFNSITYGTPEHDWEMYNRMEPLLDLDLLQGGRNVKNEVWAVFNERTRLFVYEHEIKKDVITRLKKERAPVGDTPEKAALHWIGRSFRDAIRGTMTKSAYEENRIPCLQSGLQFYRELIAELSRGGQYANALAEMFRQHNFEALHSAVAPYFLDIVKDEIGIIFP